MTLGRTDRSIEPTVGSGTGFIYFAVAEYSEPASSTHLRRNVAGRFRKRARGTSSGLMHPSEATVGVTCAIMHARPCLLMTGS